MRVSVSGKCRWCLYVLLLAQLTSLIAPLAFAGSGWKTLPTDEEIHSAALNAIPSRPVVLWATLKRHDANQPVQNPLWVNHVILAWIETNPNYHACDPNEPNCTPDTKYWCGHSNLSYENDWVFDLGEPLYGVDDLSACVGFIGYAAGWIGTDNQPPTVRVSITSQTATRIELLAQAADPDGDALSYTWYVDGSQTQATNPDVFWNNPPPGQHTVRVVVSDGRGGTAEDSVTFETGSGDDQSTVGFWELSTGKTGYSRGETVQVIYHIINLSETSPTSYSVKYEILDPLGKSVFSFQGTTHAIAPGAIDQWQSSKWIVPQTAVEGAYKVVATLIADGKEVEVGDTPFDVLSQQIYVSYTLGYDLPISAAVPLRVHFELETPSRLRGIVGVTILEEGWLTMPFCPLFVPTSNNPCIFDNPPEESELHLPKPGKMQVEYDFRVFHSRNWAGSVNFTAQLDLVDENGDVVQQQVTFTVRLETPFTVRLHKAGVQPSTLGGIALPLGQWVKGSPGKKVRVAYGAVVVVRHLAGLTYTMKNDSADMFWDITPFATGFTTEDYFKEGEESVVAALVEKVGSDQALDKTLQFLFQNAGKRAAGPVGLILDIFQGNATQGNKVVIRLRSTVGMTLDAAGGVSLRTFEGNPEVLQPDGSTLGISVGYESSMQPGGRFSTPVPYDPDGANVVIWNDELNTSPPTGSDSIEAALDTNGNGQLDDGEIRQAIQYWILGQAVPGSSQTISDAKIQKLIQMWILSTPIGGQSMRSAQPLTAFTLRVPSVLEREVWATHAATQAVEVQLFDLSGRLIIEKRSTGRRLRFSLTTRDGTPLANGIYLLRVSAQSADGAVHPGTLGKLLVLR